MKIVDIRNYSGRNIYSHKPVIKVIMDLETLADTPTTELGDFNDRLLDNFPGLKTHHCSLGHEGGFVQRLREGTLVSHVTEHLALELQCLMGYDVSFGKTRTIKPPSLYYIVYEYINEQCAVDFGYAATDIVLALIEKEEERMGRILDRLYRFSAQTELGPSTKAIMLEARRRHIPVRRLGSNSLLQLGYGKQMRLIEASLPDTISSIAVDLAKNKQLVKSMLCEHLIPVPKGGIVNSEKEAVRLAEEIGYPVVIKPMDGNQGKGVTANIDNADLVRTAYELANDYTEQVIVEKYIKGKDYRILVVGDHVAAAAERDPPYVTGDGIHTITELVAEENRNPVRGTGHSKPLTRIRLDTVARNFLERSGYRVNDIPQPGEHICLRENGNLSTGGSARDCTARVHPDNMELAVKAAQIIGLDVAGIDVVMDDISQPLTYRNGAIIEINAAPGLRMHLYPREGQGRNVAADIVDFMYPQGKHPTIPVVSITGTNGKTTVTRLISHTLALAGYKVGMTCSSGTYIGQECISQGDNTGPASARLILYNREVEAAVLETARGGIVRKGVGYDLADVGVITNINDDHLGQDDINTVEDLAFAKALVVEAVKPTGYAVLNADDKMTDYILPRVKCGKIFFAQNRGNTMVVEHIKMGGTAIVVENEAICLYKDNRPTVILSMDDIPITFEGKAVCNIENSLAAVASLIALGVPAHTIRLGLRSFRPIPSANAGRFNLFEAEDFRVLLDYGHNSSGYQSVLQFISLLEAKRLVGVIGMPGDRLNQAIYNVGRLAGQVFHKIYIKEDEDLRGRTTGEVADILYHGVIEGGASKESIEVVLAETEALKAALANALPGDLVVMFYEHFEPAFALVKEYIGETTEDAVAFWPCPDTFKPDFSYIPEVLH